MASDLCLQRLVKLPWDYNGRYGLYPGEQKLSDAVRASMSIPYFYEPVRLTHQSGKVSKLVDGGLLSNFPIDVFDAPEGTAPRWPTFGLKLSSRPDDKMIEGSVDGPFEMLTAMAATMVGFHDAIHIDRPETVARTIFIDTFGISPVDFDIDDTTSTRLYQSGRRAAQEFLASWDFEDYVSRYRSGGEEA
jgi:NTE family protein